MSTTKGPIVTAPNDAPWFDALTDADKASYIANTAELVTDLRKAAKFLNAVEHMRRFPVRSYQPEVDLQYFVNEADADPRGDFERLSAFVVEAGGTVFDRTDVESSTVQHIAEMRFGSGRVGYRVVWIERTQADG
jgi:hypothetical protein